MSGLVGLVATAGSFRTDVFVAGFVVQAANFLLEVKDTLAGGDALARIEIEIEGFADCADGSSLVFHEARAGVPLGAHARGQSAHVNSADKDVCLEFWALGLDAKAEDWQLYQANEANLTYLVDLELAQNGIGAGAKLLNFNLKTPNVGIVGVSKLWLDPPHFT